MQTIYQICNAGQHRPVEDYRRREVVCSKCGIVLEDETAEFRSRFGLSPQDAAALQADSHQVGDDMSLVSMGTDHKARSESSRGIFALGKKKVKRTKDDDSEDDKEAEKKESEEMINVGEQGSSYLQDAYNVGRYMEENGIFEWDETRGVYKFVADYRRDKWLIKISEYAFKVAASRNGRHLNVVERKVLGKEIRRIYSRLLLTKNLVPQLVVEMALYNVNLYDSDSTFKQVNADKLNEAIDNVREAIMTKCRAKRDMAAEQAILP